MKKIILASASPRRKALLEQLGLDFEVIPSDCEEEINSGLDPHDLAKKLSLEKAKSVADKNTLVIGADTFIAYKGKIIGKPRDGEEAMKILKLLQGNTHSVITGLTVIDSDTGKTVSDSIETKVHFKKLADDEIEGYILTNEPLDKAGAYGIQALGAVVVDKIDGDYFNVVGLPLSLLHDVLKKFGVNLLELKKL
jgi:septum formation protein